MSKRYGQRPSDIAKGSRQDLQFDMLVAGVGIENEVKTLDKAHKEALRKAKHRGKK